MQRRLGDIKAVVEAVAAVHQYLGLDDGHQSGLLAQRGVTCQCVGVGIQAGLRGRVVGDGDYRPPLGEARAQVSYNFV